MKRSPLITLRSLIHISIPNTFPNAVSLIHDLKRIFSKYFHFTFSIGGPTYRHRDALRRISIERWNLISSRRFIARTFGQ
jgi:hypothetical protein